MKYLELILGYAFGGIIMFCVGALVFAVIAEFFGWYDKPEGE